MSSGRAEGFAAGGDERQPERGTGAPRTKRGSFIRQICTWLWLSISLPTALTALLLVAVLNRYDAISYGRHASIVRYLIPWRLSGVAAVLPIVAVAPFLLAKPSTAAQVVLLVLGLALCEAYSVCFHRESYIAAFEPWWLPADKPVLGRPAQRRSDRRLHYLVRTQVLYLVPLIVVSLWLSSSDPSMAWLVFFAFVAKYVAPAWVDYEGYFHWDMHCSILAMKDGKVLMRIWRGICEWVLGPAVGSLPYLYSTEHLVIHHPQNAGPDDIHSPLPFRRTSILEFGHYLWKTVFVLGTTWGVATHRRCRGRTGGRVLFGAASVWIVVATALVYGRPFGYWLALAVVFRGANTAMAQYVWHGLHDGTGRAHPMSNTINWIPREPVVHGQAGSQVRASTDVVHPTSGLIDHVPNPGSDWAFYDNYHLIHHLHPRAHFEDYPRLLSVEADRIAEFGSPVVTLDQYGRFFSNLMARDLRAVASGYQSSADIDDRTRDLLVRLEPWVESRSRVSIVTEGRAGRRVDELLSAGWRKCR